MTLSEKSEIDRIEVLATGHVQVRRADTVRRDDEVVSTTYHRHVLSPGDDLSNEDPKVAVIAKAAWSATHNRKE
jgi:hypothetical protein